MLWKPDELRWSQAKQWRWNRLVSRQKHPVIVYVVPVGSLDPDRSPGDPHTDLQQCRGSDFRGFHWRHESHIIAVLTSLLSQLEQYQNKLTCGICSWLVGQRSIRSAVFFRPFLKNKKHTMFNRRNNNWVKVLRHWQNGNVSKFNLKWLFFRL